jgi:hypothetical protein
VQWNPCIGRWIFFYAWEAETHNETLMDELLDDLNRVNSIHANALKTHWINVRDPPQGWFDQYGHNTFLASAIQAKLLLYVNEVLDEQPGLLHEKCGRPLLDYSLRPKRISPVHLSDDEGIDIVSSWSWSLLYWARSGVLWLIHCIYSLIFHSTILTRVPQFDT